MTALERFDEWSERLDRLLEADPDALADVYDPETLLAIESEAGEPSLPARKAGGWRGGVTAGAVVVGMVQGVRDAVEDEDADPVVEIDQELRDRRLEPVSVHLAWGNPAASVAVVRPWLF